jgi:DNA-binding transcriptional regulator YhcF (GntR family)
VKLGQSQYGRRVKDYNERIKGQNEQNVQSFVDEKVEEGYSREEILDMLKQMGVNVK